MQVRHAAPTVSAPSTVHAATSAAAHGQDTHVFLFFFSFFWFFFFFFVWFFFYLLWPT